MINKQKRALFVMPLLVIPFITMAFWAMGGGKGNVKVEASSTGLNLQLPNAKLKDDRREDKLDYYETAEKDSLKLEESLKNDPFFQLQEQKDTIMFSLPHRSTTFNASSPFPSSNQLTGYRDPNEQKVYQKLQELQAKLNTSTSNKPKDPNLFQSSQSGISKEDVDRLEYMMKYQSADADSDPQMKDLNQMMDKILAIQHPERVKDTVGTNSVLNKRGVLPVTNHSKQSPISLLSQNTSNEVSKNGFYGLSEEHVTSVQNAVEAIIPEDQTLVNGATVKLQLSNPIDIAGVNIPTGSFIYGLATLNNERLQIEISSIRYQNSIYPVRLQVYDLDGLRGIYIPGAITRDVAKQSADNSMQLMELSSMDPSLKGQATAAGINTVKSLLSKKVKMVKVSVKAGYRVLLYDKSLSN
ncbi:MAG: conjugative transposon protein TraM [Flavisolibacter sp.]|nr:conjugative transposon protein TraM [Flavisolibacter sp.]